MSSSNPELIGPILSGIGALMSGIAALRSPGAPPGPAPGQPGGILRRSKTWWWATCALLTTVALLTGLWTWHPWRTASEVYPRPTPVASVRDPKGPTLTDGFTLAGSLSPADLQGDTVWLLVRDTGTSAGGQATQCGLNGSEISCIPVHLTEKAGNQVRLTLVTADAQGTEKLKSVNNTNPLTDPVPGTTQAWERYFSIAEPLRRK